MSTVDHPQMASDSDPHLSPQTGTGTPKTPGPIHRGRFVAVLGLVWASFIFATSCTVIRPQEFFGWIHEHVIRDDALFAGFGVFWGFAWFAIVKGWHAVEFAVLLLFSVATMHWFTGRRTTQNIAIGVTFCVVFAASDEWHQTFVPDRGGTITDVLIDSVGVLVAAAFLLRRIRVSR